MSFPRDLILIRHPPTSAPRGTCYGRRDFPLAPAADAAVVAALAALPTGRPVLSSPAPRCMGLARRLAARDGGCAHAEPRIQELDFGTWEGRPWDRIARAESDPWAADPWRVAPPDGETFAALHRRVAEALAAAPDGAILVTHAGPIRAARMILLGESFEAVFARPVPYAEPLLARERA